MNLIQIKEGDYMEINNLEMKSTSIINNNIEKL